MLDGLTLHLMIGPAVPVPAPREVVDALTSVQVTSAARQPSGFQLTFRLDPRSRLPGLLLLAGGSLPPVLRVVLFVTLRGRVEVLIDGVVTDHQMAPAVGGQPASLTVTGSDLTAVMDLVHFDGLPYPALPPVARVALILAKYATLGVVPLVIPSVLTEVPNPLEAIPRHQGTDLAYVRRLADEAGYIFCIEPGPAPGSSVAYWGPEVKVGDAQPALTADLDLHSNLESLSFQFANDRRTQYVLYVHEKTTKVPIPIPVPDVSLVNPPLGLVPPIAKRVASLPTAKFGPVRAALFGLGEQARSAEVVTGTGTVDVARYGHVLRPRRLVGVRGAGEAFDGLYYVQSVTHTLRRGEYKQSFSLSRNGLVSTVPRLAV